MRQDSETLENHYHLYAHKRTIVTIHICILKPGDNVKDLS